MTTKRHDATIAKIILDVGANYIRFLIVDEAGNILVGKVAILKDATVVEPAALAAA
jgi:hypothetical protein